MERALLTKYVSSTELTCDLPQGIKGLPLVAGMEVVEEHPNPHQPGSVED